MGSISYGGFNKSSVLVVVEATEANNDEDVIEEEPAATEGANMNDATGSANKQEHSINRQELEVSILVVW
jgi:hypothetical protein